MSPPLSRRAFAGLAAAGVLAGLTGCAPPKARWVHPSLSAEEQAAGVTACRKEARRRAYDGAADDMVLSRESQETGTLSILDRAALERSRKSGVKKLTAECLRARGYARRKKKRPAE